MTSRTPTPQVSVSINDAKAALVASETKFRRLVEDANDVIWSSDLDSTLIYISPQFKEYFGQETDEWVGKSFIPLVHPDDLSSLSAFINQVVQTGEKAAGYEFRHPYNDGSWRWVTSNISPVKDERGQVIGLQGILRDITDRKQAETELQEKMKLLALRSAIDSSLTHSRTLSDLLQHCTQKLVDHLDVAFARIWILNEPDQMLELQASNGLYTNLDGADCAVPVGQFNIGLIAQERRPHLTNDVPNDPRVSDKVWAKREGMTAFAGYPLMVNDRLLGVIALFARQPFFPSVLDTLSFISNDIALGIERQQTAHALAVSQAELTLKAQALEQSLQDLKQAQLQTVQNEKMASLGILVAGIAHEVNNPIGFLNGSINNAKDYVQDLLEQLALYQQHYPNPAALIQDHAEEIDLEFLREDLPKLLHSMQGATNRIQGISNGLRIFSRADTNQKVIADLHEGLDSTLLILKYRIKANSHRPEIEIIKDYGELPRIECFLGQLNQVFMNILANAIDVFDEIAQTRAWDDLQAHPQQITIQTIRIENHVQISIQDNGTGMTEAVKAKVFDHLFTTKPIGKGTGLGLAIARQIIVETHGGTLEVDSQMGDGTHFKIGLPYRFISI